MITVDWSAPVKTGSFASVYRATSVETGRTRTLAIKVLQENDPESVNAFRKEFATLRHLEGISCVPRAYSISRICAPRHRELHDKYGLFMEYCEGSTLLQVATGRTRPTDRQIIRLARRILTGVSEIHGHDVLHRDLHAGNLVVAPSGHVIVLDYGASCSLWRARAGKENLCLANGYEPPEASRGTQWSAASDLYMIAKSLIHARYGQVLDARDLPDTAFGKWAGICTQADPSLRPQTCQEAAAILPRR